MGATKLTCRRTPVGCAAQARLIALAFTSLWIITLAGAAVGTMEPGLAPSGRPHPSLHGTVADLVSIAATNTRVLSAPFLLVLFRFPDHRRTRQLGDLLVGGALGGNALRVGLALGRWQARLLPYVPQLPLEWLAAAVAVAAWLTLRTGAQRQSALSYLTAVLVLVAAAAAVETLAPPHITARSDKSAWAIRSGPLRSRIPIACAGGRGVGCLRLGFCAGDGTRCKVAALPSPSLALGSARPPGRRFRATSTTPGSRKGGNQT